MWPRVLNTILGIWMMAAPAIIGYTGAGRVNDRIVGPLVATFAIVAMWEATRGVRWLNAAHGFWFLVAPLIFGYDNWTQAANSAIVGVLVLTFSFFGGKVTQRFGGGWSSLLQ